MPKYNRSKKRKHQSSQKEADRASKKNRKMNSMPKGIPFKALVLALSYVDSRRYAAQVNKEWYSAVCALDDVQDIYKLNYDGNIDSSVRECNNSSLNIYCS